VKPFSEISPRRLAWILAAIAGSVCAAVAAAQVILPRVAEGRIRAHLGDQAAGLNVDVRATPAIKLLTGRVDRVTIEADRLRAGDGSSAPSLDEMLSRAGNIGKLDVRVKRLEAPQGVEARNVVLHKDGDAISASGGLDLRALRNVLPPGLSVKPLPAPEGQILLEGSASPFGASIGARARVLTEGGRVVVRAEGLPFASLVSMPVFESDQLSVDGLAAKPTGDGLVVKVRGHLNG